MFSKLIEKIYNFFDSFHSARLSTFYSKKNFDFVIDVGSHKGEFITKIIKTDTPAILFEPQINLHKELIKNTAVKDIRKIFPYALDKENISRKFYVNKLSSTSSVNAPDTSSAWIKLKKILLGGNLISEIKDMETRTLDDVFYNKFDEKDSFSNILLKIDVEGFEYNVLQGAKELLISKKVRYVQLENARYQIYKNSKKDLAMFLEEFGYKKVKSFLFPLLNFSDDIYELKS